MRTISKVVQATQISLSHASMKLFRVVGTTDIDSHGTEHAIADIKLLGHGGIIVADTETHARTWMSKYEEDSEHFGCV